MILQCAVCMYTVTDASNDQTEAITVIGGLAVCDNHLDYAHDDNLSAAIQNERKLGRI